MTTCRLISQVGVLHGLVVEIPLWALRALRQSNARNPPFLPTPSTFVCGLSLARCSGTYDLDGALNFSENFQEHPKIHGLTTPRLSKTHRVFPCETPDSMTITWESPPFSAAGSRSCAAGGCDQPLLVDDELGDEKLPSILGNTIIQEQGILIYKQDFMEW